MNAYETIKAEIILVLSALNAAEIVAYDDYDTPGLQFDAEYQKREARYLITQHGEDEYEIYVFNKRNMETMFKRDGIALAELVKVFIEDLDVKPDAWIVTTHHEHCPKCNEQIDNAIVNAKVTGSVGATYEVEEPDGEKHGAKVERESWAERQEALS